MMNSNNDATANAEDPQESLWKRIQRKSLNGWVSTKARSANVKETALIKKLQFDIQQRKKIFGVDYLTLKESSASPEELQACVEMAEMDIHSLQEQITDHEQTIAQNQESLQLKIQQHAGAAAPEGAPEPIQPPPPVPTTTTTDTTTTATPKPDLVSASEL